MICSKCGGELAAIGRGAFRHRRKAADGHRPVPVEAMPVVDPTAGVKRVLVPLGVGPLGGVVANAVEAIRLLDPMAGAIGNLYDACDDLETAQRVDKMLHAHILG